MPKSKKPKPTDHVGVTPGQFDVLVLAAINDLLVADPVITPSMAMTALQQVIVAQFEGEELERTCWLVMGAVHEYFAHLFAEPEPEVTPRGSTISVPSANPSLN